MTPKLREMQWKLYYDSGQDDLIRDFYVPALSLACRYDRVTGYFTPGALRLVARGLEPFVERKGKMRLVTGCTLNQAVVEAIQRGERKLDEAVAEVWGESLPTFHERYPRDDGLELLAWMIQKGLLSVRVAIPCDEHRRPVLQTTRIFHEKAGVMEDSAGDRLAFHGSVNETQQGWQGNWEGIHVFRSWQNDYERVQLEDAHFERLWADQMPRCLVMEVGQALEQGLLRFAPPEGQLPRRLRESTQSKDASNVTPPSPQEKDNAAATAPASHQSKETSPSSPTHQSDEASPSAAGEQSQPTKDAQHRVEAQDVVTEGVPETTHPDEQKEDTLLPTRDQNTGHEPIRDYIQEDQRKRVIWGIIVHGPMLEGIGDDVGEATSAIQAWPHQRRAFLRMYRKWPPKLLIADEVGLGKTIEAGLLLRQAWLAEKLERALILAPKAVTRQWQYELREKFNLNWPIYTGNELVWYDSRGQHEKRRAVSRSVWHKEPFVIVSSQLMRRTDRSEELCREAARYSLVLLDEAHHARRSGVAGGGQEAKPNLLLSLMRRLRLRTEGLVLLTATPMQVHPQELWDLLELLGVPREWTWGEFERFFALAERSDLQKEEIESMVRLFRATEQHWGEISEEQARALTPDLGNIRRRSLLHTLREKATTPRTRWSDNERAAAIRLMRGYTPVSCLISRHTRETLRRYAIEGKLKARIATRYVEDQFIDLQPKEREVYEEVERYISEMYNRATAKERNAVGFIMTIYRRRMASSFDALRKTLERRLQRLQGTTSASSEEAFVEEEGFQDELFGTDEIEGAQQRVLQLEEQQEIQRLLRMVCKLPTDTKTRTLHERIQTLKQTGYPQCIVFTQYTDTMRFLRQHLVGESGQKVVCFSGEGGEQRTESGDWVKISRDEAKAIFLQGKAEIMLCTDAAAEGLNFQFCGALINYDMPWNPMRVEQRIGRIDRLGQTFSRIRVMNLHYQDTVESDVYAALRERIQLFTQFVGRLQPILSSVSQRITEATLARTEEKQAARESLLRRLEQEVEDLQQKGFDLDAILENTWQELPPLAPPYDLRDLQRILAQPDLLPNGVTTRNLGPEEVGYRSLRHVEEVRVTTSPTYFDQHAESVELWSKGSPVFDVALESSALPSRQEIQSLLEQDRQRIKKLL